MHHEKVNENGKTLAMLTVSLSWSKGLNSKRAFVRRIHLKSLI